MRRWTLELPRQLRGSLERARQTQWPERIAGLSGFQPRSICLCGMGGSAMASLLSRALLLDSLAVPCTVQQDPELPSWLGEGELAGVVSYSGETWEAIAMLREARRRGARCFVVASGGSLAREPGLEDSSCFLVPEGYAPRAALGWMLPPLLLLLSRFCGSATARDPRRDLDEACAALEKEIALWEKGSALPGRDPRALAEVVNGRPVFIYAPSARLHPVAIRWKNQILENGKQMAHEAVFPELAHNEIEGWEEGLSRGPAVFLLPEDGAPAAEGPGAGDRAAASRESAVSELERAGARVLRIPPHGETPAARLLTHVLLADLASVELAARRGVDPLPVEAIRRVKEASRKEPHA